MHKKEDVDILTHPPSFILYVMCCFIVGYKLDNRGEYTLVLKDLSLVICKDFLQECGSYVLLLKLSS